ncbi:hypothetical protein A6R68_18067 [Neotoma lepida]|uniref:DUF1899 domain-containing protein n=1 Tax=Neotoma lepida TaxID=56216 RepID=A0A1A6HNI7_NEOLE|nr:hypothetical protein A6R68_18067 [Neotoma lepida]
MYYAVIIGTKLHALPSSFMNSQPKIASVGPLQMSWRPQYRSSKFRNVYGKVANREHCFDGIPITKNVHDNHFCAVNARFLAIVTESAGGGSFLVIPLEQLSFVLQARLPLDAICISKPVTG